MDMVVQKPGKQVQKNTEVFAFQKSKFIFSKRLLAFIDTMCKWENGGFSLVKISPVERGIQLLLLLFSFLGFLLITTELWIFLLHIWPGTSGAKCSSITRWWYPLDMVKRSHCPCFRSIAFTADLVTVLSYSIIITKVRNYGYTVI